MKLYKFSEVKKSANPLDARGAQDFKLANAANGAFFAATVSNGKKIITVEDCGEICNVTIKDDKITIDSSKNINPENICLADSETEERGETDGNQL